MTADPADLLVRIRRRDAGLGTYPVEAELGDGGRFTGGTLAIDPAAPVLDGHSEEYGRGLFASLFGGPIRTAYDKALAAAAAGGGGVRIRLLIDPDADELEAIRWERLYRERSGTWIPVSTAGDTPFSRYRALPTAEPRPVATLPLRILLVVSNPAVLPPGFQPVEVRQEVETFYQALAGAAKTDEVDVTIMARRADLGADLCGRLDADGFTILDGRSSLRELVRRLSGTHIVHFVGHGHLDEAPPADGPREAALFFERDEGDQFDPVTGADLVERFAAAEVAPSLVYLSACDSGRTDGAGPHPFIGIAPRLVDAGVAAVVAMQDLVPVATARKLTSDFYRVLLDGGLVDAALNQARGAVFDADARDWTVPVLFTRLHRGRLLVEHDLANRVIADDVSLTPEPEHGVVADRVTTVPVPHLRPAPVLLLPRDFPDLLGRDAEVHQTMTDLAAGSMVEFYGPAGSGKTSLLRNVANRAGAATGESVVHLADGGEPLEDALQYLFDALYEADASLRPTDADLRRYLAPCRTVIAIDDADVPRDAVQRLTEAAAQGRFVLAAVERNLWGEGRAVALGSLPNEAAVSLFERGLGRALTADERPRAAALCTALGGLPLAILQAADQAERGAWPTPQPATPATDPQVALQSAAIDALTDSERDALGVIAAAGAPLGVEHIEALTGRADAAASCESLHRAGLVRTGSPRYALAEPLPSGYEAALRVADWRSRLLAYLVRWVGQNRRSPGVLVRDLDAILATLERTDGADPKLVLELARGTEGALILSKRWQRWAWLLDREVDLASATGDQAALGWARHQQGSRSLALQDEAAARASLGEALRIREKLGDKAGAAVTRHNLGLLGPIGPIGNPWPRRLLAVGIVALVTIGGALGVRAGLEAIHAQTATVTGNFVPVAQVAPGSLDLGSVEIGKTSQAALAVTNDGNADLHVTSVALDPPIDDLTVADGCGAAVAPKDSCTIVLTFTPTAAGDRGTSLVTVDDSATGGAKVPVAAKGVAPPGVPALEIKPGALDFGSIVPGTDARQALTVASAGTGAVDISAVVPPAGPDFSIASEDCAGQTLAPGATCSIEVIFRPSATGPRSDTLSVADSTADGHHDVALSGTGLFGLPDLQVKIDVLGDATNQDDGTIAVPIIGVVRNTGDADAGPFDIVGEVFDPKVDASQPIPIGLVIDPGFGVDPGDPAVRRPTARLAAGDALKFTGRLVLGPTFASQDVGLAVAVDSCLGQEIFDPVVIAHCAVEEIDETNNTSNVIGIRMPDEPIR